LGGGLGDRGPGARPEEGSTEPRTAHGAPRTREQRAPHASAASPALWRAAGLAIALSALAALVPWPLQQWLLNRYVPAAALRELPARRGAGILVYYRQARQYSDLFSYLGANVPPGEKIYSAAPRNDVFAVNEVMLYFLAERDPGTYFWC